MFSLQVDDRDYCTPGWKCNDWQLKGVPIRIDIGQKEIQQDKYVAVRRDNSSVKMTYPRKSVAQDMKKLLVDIQKSLLDKYVDKFQNSNLNFIIHFFFSFRATEELENQTIVVKKFEEFLLGLDNKKIILAPFCGEESCEEQIKIDSSK